MNDVENAKLRRRENQRRWRIANAESVRATRKRSYLKNIDANRAKKREEIRLRRLNPECRQRARESAARYRNDNSESIRAKKRAYLERTPERNLYHNAQARALAYHIPFNIELSDVVVPAVCPVLGIPLTIGMGKSKSSSPTLDRIVPRLGYVKGNVCVISMRANRLKNDASAAELRALAAYVEAHTPKQP